jgi:hypothetical protein
MWTLSAFRGHGPLSKPSKMLDLISAAVATGLRIEHPNPAKAGAAKLRVLASSATPAATKDPKTAELPKGHPTCRSGTARTYTSGKRLSHPQK